MSFVVEFDVMTITTVLERDMAIDTKHGVIELNHRLVNHTVIRIPTEFRL